MPERNSKSVLFLCTGNYYRSRFAEIYFKSVAGKMGLAWTATSKGLALETGGGNIGPISRAAVEALKVLGVRANLDIARFPMPAMAADFDTADLIVALKQAEHLPLLQERFPAWVEKVEFWHVDDVPGALTLVETEVMGLTARLIGGGQRHEQMARETAAAGAGHEAVKETAKTKLPTVRVGRETKGRRGKGVTIVSDVPLDEAGVRELAAKLKQQCGTGGTVKDGRIEIQGDQRERLTAALEGMGYRVKRVGG